MTKLCFLLQPPSRWRVAPGNARVQQHWKRKMGFFLEEIEKEQIVYSYFCNWLISRPFLDVSSVILRLNSHEHEHVFVFKLIFITQIHRPDEGGRIRV